MNTDPIYTYRITRKVRTGGSTFVSGFFTLAAVACFALVPMIAGVPAGFLLLAVAYATDTKHARVSLCGQCGNVVVHTCTLCPTCRADLATEPRR